MFWVEALSPAPAPDPEGTTSFGADLVRFDGRYWSRGGQGFGYTGRVLSTTGDRWEAVEGDRCVVLVRADIGGDTLFSVDTDGLRWLRGGVWSRVEYPPPIYWYQRPSVYASVAFEGSLYVGGTFWVGGSSYGVLKWDGVSWNAVGPSWGVIGGLPNADRLFVTTGPSGAPTLYATSYGDIYQLEDGRWRSLGARSWTSISSPVGLFGRLEPTQGGSIRHALYATGGWLSGLSKWDGQRWLPVSEPGRLVRRVAFDPDGDLYATGWMTSAGGLPTDYFARLYLPCVASCAGDVTGDGLVDMADLAALLAAYGSVSPASDIDNSGRVDFADLNLLLAGYGRACP